MDVGSDCFSHDLMFKMTTSLVCEDDIIAQTYQLANFAIPIDMSHVIYVIQSNIIRSTLYAGSTDDERDD